MKRKFTTIKSIKDKFEDYLASCKESNKIPTKGGMALHLDTTVETLRDYQDGKYDTKVLKYSLAIKRCYLTIEEAWVQRLDGTKSVAGAIFYLKNVFRKDWRDRTETVDESARMQIEKLRVDLKDLLGKKPEPLQPKQSWENIPVKTSVGM